MPARSWSRMASWVASSKASRASVCPYSSALILSSAVQNQPGKPWLPITCVYRSGSLTAIACPFLEEMLLNLADRGAREDVAELHALGHLEAGQPRPAPGDQLFARGARPVVQDDVGLDGLVAHGIRDADHGGVEHGGMLLQGLLHLRGGHVLAGALDHILLPVHEEEAAVLVHDRLITAVQPSLAQGARRRFGILEVALHEAHAGDAADHELAHRARRHFLAALVHHLALVAEHGHAHGERLARKIQRLHEGQAHGLRHAPDLHEGGPEARVPLLELLGGDVLGVGDRGAAAGAGRPDGGAGGSGASGRASRTPPSAGHGPATACKVAAYWGSVTARRASE